jgi:hypothetical protein
MSGSMHLLDDVQYLPWYVATRGNFRLTGGRCVLLQVNWQGMRSVRLPLMHDCTALRDIVPVLLSGGRSRSSVEFGSKRKSKCRWYYSYILKGRCVVWILYDMLLRVCTHNSVEEFNAWWKMGYSEGISRRTGRYHNYIVGKKCHQKNACQLLAIDIL